VNLRGTLNRTELLWRAFLLCLMFVLCSPPASALDPNQPLSQLYHSSWGARDGITGAVMALAQTEDGYLWVGTTDGLFRFDGMYFDPYRPEAGSFPSASVSALMAAAGGGLWVGYANGGASFLKDGRVTNYSERDDLPVSRVRYLAQDQEGAVWAAVVGGLARFDGVRWQRIKMDWSYPGKSAGALFVDPQGTLWVGSEKSIMFLPKGEKQFRDTGIAAGRVLVITRAPDGTMLFYDDDAGAMRSFRPPTDSRTDPLIRIEIPARAMLFDRHGALWVVGDKLSRVPFPERGRARPISETSPDAERFTKKQGLTDDSTRSILEDREGNIWVGTDGGLDRFRHRNLTWFQLPDGVNNLSLVAGDDGEVWVGSRGYHLWPLARVPDGKQVAGAPPNVRTAYRAPDGVIWIGATDTFLRWEGGPFINIPPPEEMRKLVRSPNTRDPFTVSAITEDGSGTMWVAVGGLGVFQLKDGAWKFTEVLKDHPDWAPSFAYTDGADRVWLTYGDRVAVIERGGAARAFAAEEGLTVGPYDVIGGREEQVWVGGESGLAFLQGDRFHTLEAADGSRFNSITGIVAPAGDGLWLSAGPGIVHIPEREVRQALQRADYKVNYELFDLVSDLPEQVQKGRASYSSSAIQGTDGRLWFATQGGVASINPSGIFRNPLPPPVVIRGVIADERPYSTFAAAALPPLTKSLQIDYTALSLSAPERVRFRYKLEGWDREWQDAGTRRQAFYTNLGPGSYTFRVIASNNDGVWNEVGASIGFTVAPAWYQTTWFRLLCLVSFLFVVWAVYRLRVRQVAAAISARFDERLTERIRLAQELHDTFLQTVQGSKMVADDALEMPPDPERLRRVIEQLSVWLGQATQEGRAALNSLRSSATEKNDLAEALRRATENGLPPSSMAVNFSVIGDARDMHPIVRDEVYRIGYEAIRNACAHSGASQLSVELRYERDLVVRVKDDGKGIPPAVFAGGKDGHFGLQGMRERAGRIGAKLTLDSAATSGTDVTLVVPGAVVFRNEGVTRFAPLRAVLRRISRTSDPD
jgi:signal transduction histidine kinase/ligand-binding sensor domain-containing protein